MNVGCEAAPAGMDFDREEARADADAEVGLTPTPIGTDTDVDVSADADADVGIDTAAADIDAAPRVCGGGAFHRAREENPPPATSPAYIMDSESQELAGTPPAWSAYHYGEPSPAPATEETRVEKDETKTEEEPPARTARPRRAAAAAAAAATTAAAAKKKKKDAPTKTPKPARGRRRRRDGRRSAARTPRTRPRPRPRDKNFAARADDAGVRVLLSAAYDAKQTSKLKAQAERLGGALAASASDFTHFIAAPPRCDRDAALRALASGRPVVLPSWLEASSRAGRFAPTGDHLCRHPAFEKKQVASTSPGPSTAARAAPGALGRAGVRRPRGEREARGWEGGWRGRRGRDESRRGRD